MMGERFAASAADPAVIIVGAGVSGLLLAQYLRAQGIAFAIFERDADFSTRGLGWGLTLHWSLPALLSLLPEHLVQRLPEAYVDRQAVREGKMSAFPFFDLSAGGKPRALTPAAPESERIRVSRDRFRRLLAEGIDIQWSKAADGFHLERDGAGVTVSFEDGSQCTGKLLVACDGGNSRIRRALMAKQDGQHSDPYKIPVSLLGARVECTPAQIQPLRDLDPFFLQGTSSQNDTFAYFSILDAPGNGFVEPKEKYTCQIIASWSSSRFTLLRATESLSTNSQRQDVMRALAKSWAEPFRSFVLRNVRGDTEVKAMGLYDWAPPEDFVGHDRVALVGDAFHPMAMYRGEGANHAIVDVAGLVDLVIEPHFQPASAGGGAPSPRMLAVALDAYEAMVIKRSRPAVLASRQACLDAHHWDRIDDKSPLLTRRMMHLDFEPSPM